MKTIRIVQAIGLVVLAFAHILFMPMLERFAALHFSGWLPLAFLLLLFFLFGILLALDKWVRKPAGRRGIYVAIEAGLILFLAVFLYFEYNTFIVNSVGVLIGFLLPDCLFSGKKQA